MQDDTNKPIALPQDVWVTLFKHVLNENGAKSWRALSLVCRNFNNLLNTRPELERYLPSKKQWLALIDRLLPAHSADLDEYIKEYAKAVQISAAGPVGFKVNFQGERLAILQTFNYLECQYLALVELAMLKGFKPWHGTLLTEARKFLLAANNTVSKFAKLMNIANNKELARIDQQSKEYFVYLHAEMILDTFKHLPIEKAISSKPLEQDSKACAIL